MGASCRIFEQYSCSGILALAYGIFEQYSGSIGIFAFAYGIFEKHNGSIVIFASAYGIFKQYTGYDAWIRSST